jgi:hypothetical protein
LDKLTLVNQRPFCRIFHLVIFQVHRRDAADKVRQTQKQPTCVVDDRSGVDDIGGHRISHRLGLE